MRGKPVSSCQSCASKNLQSVLCLGYLPLVNDMHSIVEPQREQSFFPTELLHCQDCQLVQLGYIVPPEILFPSSYPYTSGTTKALRENFKDLAAECVDLFNLEQNDLVLDIASNDGTLLSNFKGKCRILGIEPTDTAKIALANGIPTYQGFFRKGLSLNEESLNCKLRGNTKLVTATNVFAHVPYVNNFVDGVLQILAPNGVFVTESHYLPDLLDKCQFDAIYHEHLRYYSLTSLKNLFERHGLEIIKAKRIPTHGGSIRVYAARKSEYSVDQSVIDLLEMENSLPTKLEGFSRRVKQVRHWLRQDLEHLEIFGISAPSRATTLINYCGLQDKLTCVVEVPSSKKIGHYIPGTQIPVINEEDLFESQPHNALILSWHIADDLARNLRAKGYNGNLRVPLPTPAILPI